MAETMSRDEIIEWATTRLNNAEGDMNNNLIPFNVQQFSEFILAYHSDYMSSAGLWGFKNPSGVVVCSPKFLFEPICVGDKYIVCTGTGWENYEGIPENRIWSKEMYWGVINSNFETIIPCEYDSLECISEDEYDENDEPIDNKLDYFVCRKYNDDKNKFYLESEVRNSKNELVIDGYNDVDYRIEYDQLVVYKDRERWGDSSNPGYAGVYDLKLNKEIIAPNKYHQIEIIDHNIFTQSADVENFYNATLINEKDEIIGEKEIWNQVCHMFHDKSKYKFQASTMDGKYYVFNIINNKIEDLTEVSHDEYLKIYKKSRMKNDVNLN